MTLTFAVMKKEKREVMFDLVREYRSSDLTQKEFCEQEGISVNQLRRWITLYNKSISTGELSQNTSSGFSLVHFNRQNCINGFEINYPNGVSIKCHAEMDLSQLRQLIQLL